MSSIIGKTVIIRPKASRDAFDMFLVGQTAVVESIETDFEGRMYAAVVIDSDDGRDLGLKKLPGHRFFFDIDELEMVDERPRILVGGLGNIFFGDDAFGIEVVKKLSEAEFTANVKVVDFGIRGIDLAYEIADGYDLVILVDTAQFGAQAGTLAVMMPQMQNVPETVEHDLTPDRALQLAKTLSDKVAKILLIGCEPANLDFNSQMSSEVANAVDLAVVKVREMIEEHEYGQ